MTMTRYRGTQRAKAVEQNYSPHYVDVAVPPGGLGPRLNAMYDFHTRNGIQPKRGQARFDANGSVIRWCFADPVIAAAFANQFKG
jgi:hypothetical protein